MNNIIQDRNDKSRYETELFQKNNSKTYTDEELQIGARYLADVSCNNAGVRLRSSPSTSASVVGYWPNGRLGVVEYTGDSVWLRCNWKKTVAYIQKTYLTNFQLIDFWEYDVLARVAEQEKNVDHALKYYGPNWDTTSDFYDWCHYCADWLVGHSDWYFSTTPNTPNCREGVLYFMQRSNLFYFVNAWHKADIFDHCSDVREYMTSRALTADEDEFIAWIGDYAYFRKSIDDVGYNSNEVSYHVGIVTHVEPYGNGYRVSIAQGNTNGTYNSDSYDIIDYTPSPSATNPQLYNDRFNSKLVGFGIGIGRG